MLLAYPKGSEIFTYIVIMLSSWNLLTVMSDRLIMQDVRKYGAFKRK